jgi:hypothetical protein
MTTTLAEEASLSLYARAAAFARRHRWPLGGAALSALVIALVLLASLPTGDQSPARTVPSGSRLAASAAAGDVEVLIISKRGSLSAQVAYPSAKGWLSVPLRAAPSDAVAAWTGTEGSGPVPALSAVYGRVTGRTVEVVWSDGRRTTVRTTSDGVYVVARDRYVGSARVRVLDKAGKTVLEIDGPAR